MDQDFVYSFSGTHYEMGIQQGKAFGEFAHQAWDNLKSLEEVQGLKPKYLPTSLFLKLASKKAYKWLSPMFKTHAPNQTERIKGISTGSGLSEPLFYLFSGLELMLGTPDWELPHIKTGCTSIAYQSSFTEAGHTMISRNFDYAKFVVPYLILRKNSPMELNQTYDLTAGVLPGTFNGINEHGVFIGTDEAFPVSEKKDGLSASILIQEALEKCSNTEEVVDFFSKSPRGSGNVILVADPSNNMKVLEYTSNRLRVREPDRGDKFIVATNHYVLNEFKEVDLPRQAVFGKKSPKGLYGMCINETSYIRKETAERLIRDLKRKVTVEDMMNLHRDHSSSPDGRGGMNTLCHHDQLNISAASMIFDLETLDAWICLGLPCENKYNKINFNSI